MMGFLVKVPHFGHFDHSFSPKLIFFALRAIFIQSKVFYHIFWVMLHGSQLNMKESISLSESRFFWIGKQWCQMWPNARLAFEK